MAWHIVRRPRGLIAGAIQYGHLNVQITLGYAGTYDSGLPDEHAYEDNWLFRLDTLAENHSQLTEAEHVSGPAADNYRHIAEVRQHAAQLQDLVEDHLTPSLRHHRERAELDRLRAIIRRHDHGK